MDDRQLGVSKLRKIARILREKLSVRIVHQGFPIFSPVSEEVSSISNWV